jgi:hypothetical protein
LLAAKGSATRIPEVVDLGERRDRLHLPGKPRAGGVEPFRIEAQPEEPLAERGEPREDIALDLRHPELGL